jgi:hypothetical protein
MQGDGAPRTNAPPTAVEALPPATELRAAGLITCTAHDSGGRCWGFSHDGARRATRVDLNDLGRPVELATASAHACARQADGTVSCWGDFEWTVDNAKSFLRPAVRGVTRLVTGDDFMCAITEGKVVCWGRNDRGQLGRAPDDDVHASPIGVAGVSDAVKLAAGEGQACAVHATGAVTCWGANEEGELGLGTRTTTELPHPTLRGLPDVRDMCIGSSHACALTGDGHVHCWGVNAAGQVGDGTRERRANPTRVRGIQ